MTDPRIVECAKAMVEAASGPWGRLSEAGRMTALIEARACILKWLEQPVTAPMVDAGFEGLKPRVNAPSPTLTGTTPDAVYTAMCAQAAKEIIS